MTSESSSVQLSNIIGKVLIGVVVGSTLLGCSNVDLVVFVSEHLLGDASQYPGSSAESSPLKEEGEDQENVGQWVVQEGNGEGRCSQLPCDGGKDGGDDGSVEAKVEEGLGTILDSKDVLSRSRLDVHGGDRGNDEEGSDNGELTSNHESRKVLSITLEEKMAGLFAEERCSTLVGRKLGNGEEGNLHTLQHTNNGHEDEENDEGNSWWNSIPHRSLSGEKSIDGYGKAKAKDGKGEHAANPEEKGCSSASWGLVRLNWLSGQHSNKQLDEVGGM